MTYKLYTLDNQFIEETDKHPYNFTGIVEYHEGTREWYVNGKYYRIDGPEHEGSNGLKYWYVNDKLHRLGGPAVEHANGAKWWYINGKLVTEEQHNLLHSVMKLKKLA